MKYGFDIQTLIDYLENTPEDSWRIDTVRSKDGKTNVAGNSKLNKKSPKNIKTTLISL